MYSQPAMTKKTDDDQLAMGCGTLVLLPAVWSLRCIDHLITAINMKRSIVDQIS